MTYAQGMNIARALLDKDRDERIDGLFAIERELRSLLDHRLEPFGVTYAQYSLLRFIADPPGIDSAGRAVQASDIVQYFGFAPRTVTVAINALVAKKLVLRRKSAKDGRAQELTLSSKGHQTLTAATPVYNKSKEVFSTLPRLNWNRLWATIPYTLLEIANQNRKDSLKKSQD